ncbi:6482_t:CDS:2 [Diversispora eburnea]|uniref:6482_t:CDS:1 n=1 Tax=Diversispora eburnea TaxID=1213867 RepID=A0A9N8V1V8_9GLOM|nr:6482_t:CDS:2 [Diversispora eburnea]
MDGDHIISDMDDDCCFNLDDLNNLEEVSDLDPLLDPNEIIKEIPIYLSQQLSNKLYIVQFPVRPRSNPYVGKNTPREARYKPQTNKLELDIPLQTNSLWYNRDRGEELMLGLNEKEAQTIYDRTWKRGDQTDGLLDKQTLQSTIVPPQANYWMGVMKDAQVLEEEGNLNDLKGVKSMNTDDPGNAATESNSDKSILKKHARPKSQQRVGEEEIWMKMRYCDMESIETSNLFDQLITINNDPLICKTANMNEYLDRINQITANNPTTATTFGAKSQPINNPKNQNNTRGKGTTRGARGSRGSRGKKNQRGKHT